MSQSKFDFHEIFFRSLTISSPILSPVLIEILETFLEKNMFRLKYFSNSFAWLDRCWTLRRKSSAKGILLSSFAFSIVTKRQNITLGF